MKKYCLFSTCFDRRGILAILSDQISEALRFTRNMMVPIKIPTPTPTPDRGGPVACLGGPVAYSVGSQNTIMVAVGSRLLYPFGFNCAHSVVPSSVLAATMAPKANAAHFRAGRSSWNSSGNVSRARLFP